MLEKMLSIFKDFWNIYIKPIFIVKELEDKIFLLNKEIVEQKMLVKKLQTQLAKLKGDNKERDYWDNKWVKNKIIYSAQDGINRDVRNLICPKSYILEKVANRWRGLEPEEIAYKSVCWAINNLTYVGDMTTHKAAEFWQHPEETYQTRKGDCEDGALLITSLMLISGCPAYRVKVCAGWVKSGDEKGGHAYVIFLRDDQTWCVLDWCYWKNKKQIRDRKEHKDESNYYEIWWTFNNLYSWAQKSTTI